MFDFVTLASTTMVTQEAMPHELVSPGWNVALTIYTLIGGVLVIGLGWGGNKLMDLINVKIDNELLKGILGRFVGSVNDAVAMVNQTLKKEILAAKDPSSPGGEKITEGERKRLLDAVWDALKAEYGGWQGIFGTLKKIGIGDEGAARAKIDTMIEAAVIKQKLNPR